MELTRKLLDELETDVRAKLNATAGLAGNVLVSGADVLSLIAAARELEELKGALEGSPVAAEPLYGALAYLEAEVSQYPHPRILRAKELLESTLPEEPTNDRYPGGVEVTERISHEEARRLAGGIIAEQFPATSSDLLAYVTQQQALEADTVSRAENEAEVERLEPLYGALAYLEAEVSQYPHPRAASSRILRAKELLESVLPPEPTNGR